MIDLHSWQHPHTFGQDRVKPGKRRTLIVIALTATMMGAEIAGFLRRGVE